MTISFARHLEGLDYDPAKVTTATCQLLFPVPLLPSAMTLARRITQALEAVSRRAPLRADGQSNA
jgi:hypothetical protein